MKNYQLKIPLFPDDMFDRIKREYALQDVVALQKKIEKLKQQIAGFKGYRTKRKKRKK